VLDAAFDERRPRTREYLAVMRSLWCDEVSRHEGEYYSLPPCRMQPKPVQRPHPPLYFGGESDAALRRVAELGDGWHGFNHLPDSAAASVQRLEQALAAAGRKRGEVDVTIGAYLQPVEPMHLPAYVDAGVDQLVLTAFGFDPHGISDEVARLGDAFVGPAASL